MYDVCEIDCCVGADPEQVHIAFVDDRDKMSANWVTKFDGDSVVYYGTSENQLTEKASGSSHVCGFFVAYFRRILLVDGKDGFIL